MQGDSTGRKSGMRKTEKMTGREERQGKTPFIIVITISENILSW